MFINLFPGQAPATDQPRSSRPDVRNPLLTLPSAARAADMPDEARQWLIAFLYDLRRDCSAKAAKAWQSYKAPSAFYWRVCAVYCGHIAKVLRKVESTRAGKRTPDSETLPKD